MEIKDGISVYGTFVSFHKGQLELSGVPNHYWEVLFRKLKDQIFDAGNVFRILKIKSDDATSMKVVVNHEEGINVGDPSHIYLIDHAWTYLVNEAKSHLQQMPGLLNRMKSLMSICDNLTTEDSINAVFAEMWKFNQTYSVGSMSNVESRLPVWYIMDEFGSAIQHAEEPNFRVVPLIYLPEQIPYSLLFPIKNLSKDEEVTRDFVEGPIRTTSDRRVLLLPWQPSSFISEDFKQEEPGEEYFLEGHIIESLPNLDTIKASAISLETNMKLKVYSEYEFVNNYLTDSRFELTNDEDAANILWYTHHFKQFEDLSESIIPKFVNQFPFEHVITIKDLLSIVCRRSKNINKTMDSELLEMYPLWLPVTYNLKTELTKFVSYFQHRENKGLDNHWICKPWNLARGLDTHITNNINYIVRLPFTGPKIAQKYIEDPVLFNRLDCGLVKFDIRYVLLLKSIQPLEVYVYRNFFLRFANKPFELNDFDIYDKHFTVMNYTDNSSLYRKLCDEFIEDFQTQYAGHQWETLEKKIFSMFLEILEAATCKQPPLGIGHNPQSRALYAADIMLAWRTDEEGCRVMQPKLLEINWTPDCQRACEYYPDFYNDIFSLLFCNEVRDVFVPL